MIRYHRHGRRRRRLWDRLREEDEDRDDSEDGRNGVHYYFKDWDGGRLRMQVGLEAEDATHGSWDSDTEEIYDVVEEGEE